MSTEPSQLTPIEAIPPHPLAMLAQMVKDGADPDALKKMMELAKEWRQMEAAEKHALALAAFQSACPMVPKARAVNRKDGGTMYKFANFEDVQAVARPHLNANGIAVSFSTPPTTEGMWLMIVHVSVGSCTRDYPFTGPEMTAIDLQSYAKSKPGGMNVEQARGEQISYRKRTCFCAALGIVVCDEDSDMAAPAQPIDADDQRKVLRLLDETDSDLDQFLAWCRQASGAEIDAVADIPQSLMPKALAILRQKKGKVTG